MPNSPILRRLTLILILVPFISVSYTHLDVYKRQGVYKPADIDALVISSGNVQITFGKDLSRANLPNPRGGGGGAGRDPAKDFSATSIIVNGKEIGHNIHGVEPRDVNARRTFYLDSYTGTDLL